MLNKEFLENIDNILNGKFLPNSHINYNFKLIPYSSLGNENGLLIGFKPDYIKIYTDDDCFEKEAIIGIYQGILSGKSNEYNAIIGL